MQDNKTINFLSKSIRYFGNLLIFHKDDLSAGRNTAEILQNSCEEFKSVASHF